MIFLELVLVMFLCFCYIFFDVFLIIVKLKKKLVVFFKLDVLIQGSLFRFTFFVKSRFFSVIGLFIVFEEERCQGFK